MTDKPQIVLGSRNRKKSGEIKELLAPHGIDVVSIADVADIAEVVEDGETFAENAAKKAREPALELSRWVLAEDSGLMVDALDGRPGIYSARYSRRKRQRPTKQRQVAGGVGRCSPRKTFSGICLQHRPVRSGWADPADNRSALSRTDHRPSAGEQRVWLRSAVFDSRISPNVRRVGRGGQADDSVIVHGRLQRFIPQLVAVVRRAMLSVAVAGNCRQSGGGLPNPGMVGQSSLTLRTISKKSIPDSQNSSCKVRVKAENGVLS